MPQLIAYFSRADENYVCGTIKNLTVGNTEAAVKILQKHTGGELFKIQPAVPYSSNYNECIAQAQDDQQRDARPELKKYPQSLEKYDTVYLGYPNYWGTMPMAVFTFLEHFDFSGKTIVPLCTHEGSGMGRSEQDIKRLCPGAIVKRGLAVRGAAVSHSEKDIRNWIEKFI